MTIHFDQYRIEVTSRANAKRLILRHAQHTDYFTLTVPKGTQKKTILDFLNSNVEWMRNTMAAESAQGKPTLMQTGVFTFRDWEIHATLRTTAKKIILHHRPHEAFFTLTIPAGTTHDDVMDMLEKNIAWMQKAMDREEILDWQPAFAAGEQHMVLGKLVTLGKDGVPCGQTAFLRYRTEQLKTLLSAELNKWQRKMGVQVQSVTLRSLRSKWGSCKPRTCELTFALELGMYPPCCVTETVVHELTHIHHANHSKAFYDEMTRWYPEWKTARDLKSTFNINPRKPE